MPATRSSIAVPVGLGRAVSVSEGIEAGASSPASTDVPIASRAKISGQLTGKTGGHGLMSAVTRVPAAEKKTTVIPDGVIAGSALRSFACVPSLDRFTRVVVPRTRSRTNMSGHRPGGVWNTGGQPFVSPGTRFADDEKNAT